MDNLNGVMQYRGHYENFDNAASAPCFGIDIGTDSQSHHRPFPDDYFAANYPAQGYLNVDNQQPNGHHHHHQHHQFDASASSAASAASQANGYAGADRYHQRFPNVPNGHQSNGQPGGNGGSGGGNEAAEILDLDSHKVHVYQPPAPSVGVSLQSDSNSARPNTPKTPARPDGQSPSGGWNNFGAPTARSDYQNPGAAGSFASEIQSDAPLTDVPLESEPAKVRERNTSGKGNDRTSEGGRPKTYSCEPCGKWFTSNGHLKRHFNTTLHKNATKSFSNKLDGAPPLEPVEQLKNAVVVAQPVEEISSQQVVSKVEDTVQPAFVVPDQTAEVQQQHFNSQPLMNCDQQQRWMMPQATAHMQPSTITMDYANQQQQSYQSVSYQSHNSLDSMSHYNSVPQQTYQSYTNGQPEEQYPTQMFNGQEKKLEVQADLYNRTLPNNMYYQTNLPVLKTEQVQSYDHSMQQSMMPSSQPFYPTSSNPINQVVFNNNNIIRQDGMLESGDALPDVKMADYNTFKDSSTEDNSMKDSDADEPPDEASPPEVMPVSKPANKASNGKKKQQEENGGGGGGGTGSANGTFKCTQCDKAFNRICYLTQHNNTFHKGDKPFKCHLCGKRFQNADLFDQHQQKHAGDKPYKCSLCPKQFNHKTDLRRHMCLHTGQKPFMCQICNKGFIRKDHMVKHAQTHTKRSALHAQQSPAQLH